MVVWMHGNMRQCWALLHSATSIASGISNAESNGDLKDAAQYLVTTQAHCQNDQNTCPHRSDRMFCEKTASQLHGAQMKIQSCNQSQSSE